MQATVLLCRQRQQVQADDAEKVEEFEAGPALLPLPETRSCLHTSDALLFR